MEYVCFCISLQSQKISNLLQDVDDDSNVATKGIRKWIYAQDEKKYPEFKAGDTVTVTYKIKEENKERLQKFRGVVIQRKGAGTTQTFTVRKISNGVGVERIFPLYSPFISEIELNKSGKVRRARIFYLRNLTGKKARIKEKKFAGVVAEETAKAE